MTVNNMQISLVVNVASECGYTDLNYRELVSLQEDYHDRGFNVLAFPCNQFGGQEPASNEDILRFVKEKYDVNFPMFAKVDVKGEQIAAVYEHLTGTLLSSPKWNFVNTWWTEAVRWFSSLKSRMILPTSDSQ